jgi:hypothetical protein
MSALGHKRTFALQNGMSALPPKATSNATYESPLRAISGYWAAQSLYPVYPEIRHSCPVVAQPFDAHINGMTRIAVECLSCGHCSSIPEERLKAFGISPDAPIAKFIRRLTCTECGSHSVRAYRYDPQNVS